MCEWLGAWSQTLWAVMRLAPAQRGTTAFFEQRGLSEVHIGEGRLTPVPVPVQADCEGAASASAHEERRPHWHEKPTGRPCEIEITSDFQHQTQTEFSV